jgi:hypothetical protein
MGVDVNELFSPIERRAMRDLRDLRVVEKRAWRTVRNKQFEAPGSAEYIIACTTVQQIAALRDILVRNLSYWRDGK